MPIKGKTETPFELQVAVAVNRLWNAGYVLGMHLADLPNCETPHCIVLLCIYSVCTCMNIEWDQLFSSILCKVHDVWLKQCKI